MAIFGDSAPWLESEASGTYDNPEDAALPVELSSFTANVINNKVNLRWQTETEIDNYGFEVERSIKNSTDESIWKKIGFVNGHGNSNSVKKYSFIDSDLTGGTIFQYRLKQIDTNGSYSLSDAVEVEVIPKEFVLFQNYPNPFNPSTEIKFQLNEKGILKLSVMDILGREIKTLANSAYEPGSYKVKWNGNDDNNNGVSTGVYLYKIEFNSESNKIVQLKKMLFVK